jgi:hypothetical protein
MNKRQSFLNNYRMVCLIYFVVYRRARGWMAKELDFYLTGLRDVYFLRRDQTGSGVHPASYPMGNWSNYYRNKAAGT